MKKIMAVLILFLNFILCNAQSALESFDLFLYTKETASNFNQVPYFDVENKTIKFRGNTYYINMEKIDYNKGTGDNTDNTYRVFINSFDFIEPLILEVMSGNFQNFEVLKNIIFQYIRFENDIKFEWYDHSMGKRSQLLSVFYLSSYNLLSKSEKEEIEKRLSIEREGLLNDKLYTKVGNHGVFQDIGLLSISKALKDEENFKFALNRLRSHFNNSFSLEGVHLENSTGYQEALYLMFKKIFENINLEFKEKEILEKTKILVDVEGSLISRGDTLYKEKKSLNKDFLIEKIDDGLVYFSNKNYSSVFISGSKGHVHKHSDNLSFNLNVGGMEFFVDPGMYKYNYSDEVSSFLIRPEAHNTIYEKYKNPLWVNEKYEKNIYLEKIKKGSYLGTSYQFKNSVFSRNIIYNPKNIILKDYVKSKQEKEIVTNFHLHPEVKVEKIKDSLFKLTRNNISIYICSQKNIEFLQNDNISKIIINNNVVSSKRLVISEKSKNFSNIIQISLDDLSSLKLDKIKMEKKQLKKEITKKLDVDYSINIDKNIISTVVKANTEKYTVRAYLYKNGYSFGFKEGKINENIIFSDLELGKYYIVYRVYDGTIDNLVSFGYSHSVEVTQKPVKIIRKKVIRNDKYYTFEIEVEDEDLQYAFYLYKDGKKKATKWYTKEKTYKVELENSGNYKIMYFIKRGNDIIKTGYFNDIIIEKIENKKESK